MTQTQSTERYSGGSKERAQENLAAGNATEADQRVLNGEACVWCGGNFPDASFRKGVESSYCSQECAEEGRLRRGGEYNPMCLHKPACINAVFKAMNEYLI